MRRGLVLGILVMAGALSMTVAAFQQQPPQPSADAIEVDKIKDNLYVLKGGGGNTAVFITAKGVVVVDTKNPGWGQPIIDKIKTLTDKPVTTIINTHTHGDHVSGNVEFPPTVDVIVQENTKKYMEQANPVYSLQTTPPDNIFTKNGGRGLPKRTFKDTWTIGSGKEQIDLRYFGPAHTGGDAFVIFRDYRVMHVGDTMPTRDFPIMAKKTEAFVYTGSALRIEPNTEDHTVNFRFDDEPSHPEHWPDSAEHDALFAPDAVAFARRVMNAHSLRFGYHPHNAEPVEAVFEVSGLTELFGPSAKDCGWPK